MNRKYQICTYCVMDTTDPDIVFNENGICNHCINGIKKLDLLPKTIEDEKNRINSILTTIKKSQTRYNCLLGISGGVDSSYLAYLAWKMGLNPLVVHFDNGWNSELAVTNIQKIISKTGFDFISYVIDWEEFKDLQRSFLKASVVDIEMLTDHAITATIFKFAKKYKIKYILSGENIATESCMPNAWVWRKQDLRNIKHIQSLFGSKKIRKFPTLSTLSWIYHKKKYQVIRLLDNVIYSKKRAIETLENEFGWVPYRYKHEESIFTKFYQNYILVNKFGIDKRRSHLSSLIINNEITRKAALKELEQNPYLSSMKMRQDKSYVLKKLAFSEEEFDLIMKASPIPHEHYKTDLFFLETCIKLKRIIKKIFLCEFDYKQ